MVKLLSLKLNIIIKFNQGSEKSTAINTWKKRIWMPQLFNATITHRTPKDI